MRDNALDQHFGRLIASDNSFAGGDGDFQLKSVVKHDNSGRKQGGHPDDDTHRLPIRRFTVDR